MAGFLIRWIFASILVLATYNPTPYNYVTWALENYELRLSLAVLGGIVLLIGYIIFLRATFRSIGVVGIVLILALVAAALWVLSDFGILTLEDSTALTWVALGVLAFILAVGMSWSHVRRTISGQSDVDDVDE